MYARIFFEIPLNHGFDYQIPHHLQDKIHLGMRVLAPFGKEKKTGYVIEILTQPEVKEVKDIIDLPDEYPIFNKNLLKLAHWISDYYLCPLGLVLRTMLPAPIRKFHSPRKRSLQEESGNFPLEPPRLLNEEQRIAWETLSRAIASKIFSITLLYGITGSGKTELYLFAIAAVLAQGKGAIVLVPEISLTPQTWERIINRFGKTVALLHSRMSQGERASAWERIRSGEAKIIVGPRSALFAPIENLGIIIVDEEHERSYKQEELPRYHARDVAIMRAKIENVPVLLGSATPSLESYFNAQEGRYQLITLTKRVENRPLPTVHIVDMRREAEVLGRLFSFSKSLTGAVQKVLAQKEQTILFLNRRGYAPVILCPHCGKILTCSECDQTMTYHQLGEKLLCHLCNAQKEIPSACPQCGKGKLHRLGVGTQRIEAHLGKLFPQAKIQRMDTDSTRGKDAHRKIFERFNKGDIEILVGTQMIAKGLDFPNVTLVGVMSADISMNLPDFRMGENTFQLLTQVAGRAGRGEKPGTVLVQTFTPFHPIIRAAVQHDYLKFYEIELSYRKQLGYPPFYRIMSLGVDGISAMRVIETAKKIAQELHSRLPSLVRILGPQEAPLSKLKGRSRWQIILFYPRGKNIHEIIKKMLEKFRDEKGVRLALDVDPVSLI